MTQPRTTRRVIAAALSVGALLATAACSSGTAASPAASGSASAATGANWDETGPITYAQGKDTSGNLLAQIDQWNKAGLPAVRISVNISARHFRKEGMAADLMQIVNAHRPQHGWRPA